jgi:hypothetical protein
VYKTIENTILNEEKLMAFPLKSGKRHSMSTFAPHIGHITGSLSQRNKLRERNKEHPDWK